MFYVSDFGPQYDFGMRKVKDFIKNQPKITESSNINVGYYNNSLVFELSLAGIKKENITVSYNGNVIEIKAVYEKEKNINYVLNKLKLNNVIQKLSLFNEYIGGAVKWKFVNGLLTIVVEPFNSTQGDSVQPSDDNENFFNDIQDETQTNIP